MSRLMDDQQVLVTNLEKLYDTFKKEGMSRRTPERKKQYEAARVKLWVDIVANHEVLMASKPPDSYEQKFKDISVINLKFTQKMENWIAVKPSLNPTPAVDYKSSVNDDLYEDASGEHKPDSLLSNVDLTSSSTLERILLMMAENQTRQRNDMSKTNWTEIELFTFLQSKLSGEAADTIEDFEITKESYSLAWEMLDERYSNRRKLLECLVDTLMDNNLKVQYSSVQSVTKFIKAFNSVLVNMKQLKFTSEEFMVEVFLTKLDKKTRGRFEDSLGYTTDTPAAKKVSEFLQREKDVWHRFAPSISKINPKPLQTTAHVTTDSKTDAIKKCFICGKEHLIIECDQFLSSNDREKLLRKHKICIFCADHAYSRSYPCRKKKYLKCDYCQGTHINLLHPLEKTEDQSEENSSVMLTENAKQNIAILPTAVAKLLDRTGNECSVRCLIDLCAERSYVSENIVQQLNLRKHRTNVTISGINGISGKVTSYVHLTLKLDDPEVKSIEIEALVVPKISGVLPTTKLPDELKNFKHQLADPSFDKQSFVGALLGGDVVPRLFRQGIPNEVTPEGLLLQPTYLGWIVSGSTTKPKQYVSTFVTMNENMEKLTKDQELSQRIIDFYELPDYEDIKNSEVDYCEQLFKEKHYRLPSGRYVVPIPWKKDTVELGHSYRRTIRMYKGQEGKWLRNQQHYEMSNKFMMEYEDLGHMSRIPKEQESSDSKEVYYIPYLSILRKNALTTKLRNVFNASMPSSNGISLNDTMCEGPKLQTSIRDILMTSRSFKFIYSADISMMFRQILVRPEDRDKLRVIWRPSVNTPPREYRLNTVTYGTDAAPYLAIRTIQQCAEDNAKPEIASIINKAFYVDDLLYGSDSVVEAKQQIEGIREALSAGKFPITKWMTNNPEILSNVPAKDRITSYLEENKTEIKLLGVTYDFESDHFRLNLKEPEAPTYTKRGISSMSASFYDPMGFILPFVMMLRIFLQRVWQQKVDWDDKLADDHQHYFRHCLQGLSKLNNIKIPRYIPANIENIVELIGFADASSHAQAAVIYSRIKTSSGYHIRLLIAKGNVSKWKTATVVESKQCTIPKLELEALVTLAELFKNIKNSFGHRRIKFTAYTDSLVALAWVRSTKKLDKRFIERRVTKIRDIFDPKNLHYVKSEENPADPASRGLTADQLSTCSLWYLGPPWLQNEELPTTPYNVDTKNFVSLTPAEPKEDMFACYSSWIRVLRMVSYCLSWGKRRTGVFKADDIIRAKLSVLLYYQHLYLGDTIRILKQGKIVPKTHWLYRLSPFVDENNLLRVGGRLGNANEIPESQRHPIIIPKSHCLNLLVRYTHLINYHAPNSLMLRLLVEEYWIPGVKNVIRSCIRRCPKCIRWNAQSIQPEMAQLPKERVTPSATFEKVGVDLCGPFIIKASPLRFDKTMKVWVVNFVCLSTKAVHLEVVTSLSSEHFLAAFSRFCCRRGTSVEVWSDNGTNFIGANRMLRETWEQIVRDCEQRTAIQEVAWKFIPRHSPTFGGLWEACVKSLKYFIKRMADVKNLTYEELETLLCKIEALLNSRPLCANPLTPEEEPALTPFHFINQRGYKPTPIDVANKVPLTKKWLMIHRIQQDFWQRFKTEYLRELQTKVKWQKPQPNLCIDDIVLIKEPSSNAGDWKMGRITKTYPDPNGIVRKVDVFTSSKTNTLHAVNQLVPLLKSSDEEKNELQKEEAIDNTTKQTLRRSPRLANKVSLVHLCLLVLFTFSSCVNSLSTEELAPGVHLKQLDKVYMKVFDMEFSIKTNINLTQDLNTIRKATEEFHKECVNIGGKSKSIYNQCLTLKTSLSQLAQRTSTEMQESYHKRSKRWISLTSKTFWKAAPAIATSLGMVYQETQIHSLQNQLSETKAKLQKTANVLLNVTNLEYEAIEGKLNEVIGKQQEILLEETIISYAQSIELLCSRLKDKHDSITTSIKPLLELRKFAEPLLEKMPTMHLPDIGDDIFSIYAPSKTIQDDLTIVTFIIPIVNHQVLNVYLLISVPNSIGETLLLSNHDKFQRVVVNPITNTFADATTLSNLHPQLIENVPMLPLSDCLSSLLSTQNDEGSCEHELIETLNEEILPVYHDLVIVFTNDEVITSIECNGLAKMFTAPAILVNTTECSVITGKQAVGSRKAVVLMQDIQTSENENITPTSNIGIEQLTHNPLAVELRESLKANNMWSTMLYPNTGYLIAEIMILITVIFFTIVLIKCCCYRRPSSTQWYPDFNGPDSKMTIKDIEDTICSIVD